MKRKTGPRTYYDVLDVPPRTSDEDVQFAWRRQALRWHPDRNPKNREQAERRLTLINEAYTVLKTRPQRDAYDRRIAALISSRKKKEPAGKKLWMAAFLVLREILWPFAPEKEGRRGY